MRKSAQEGLIEFACTVDPKYDPQWFHVEIARKLEEVYYRVLKGESPRVMIFMPPRHGKSDEATQKYPAWVLGKQPTFPIIVSSYSQDLATNFGQGTRDIMDSSNYRFVFNTRLREDTTAKANWMTNDKGGYLAVGVGGSITGKGFKIGIVDDPFKNREEADSPVVREAVWKWYGSTFETREEGASAIIVILTRWHDDDLAGRLLKRQEESAANGEDFYDKWEVLQYKAIAEEDEPHRKKGEALWADKFSYEKLMTKKNSMGSYEFSALYQQNPIDLENQEFKQEWIQYRTMETVSQMTTRKFATIDPAGSKKKKSDNTGVTRNWVNAQNEWNISTRNYRINSKGIMDLIFTLHEEGFEKIGIEEGLYFEAIEPFFKEEKEKRGIYPNVVPLKHGGTMKEVRIRGLIPRYESRKIFHIENTCTDLEKEYERFPKAAHDDCLDSLAYQSQLASLPVGNEGDTISQSQMMRILSAEVNPQEGTIIVGINTDFPLHYVMGNREGLFYNTMKDVGDPFDQLLKELKDYERVFIFTNEGGEVLGIEKLRAKHKVFVCNLDTIDKSQQVIKWGVDKEYGHVNTDRNKLVQMVVDEMKDRRITLSGDQAGWKEFIAEWTALYRTWIRDEDGKMEYIWETNAPQHFVKATLFWRIGMDRFGQEVGGFIGDKEDFFPQKGRVIVPEVNVTQKKVDPLVEMVKKAKEGGFI